MKTVVPDDSWRDLLGLRNNPRLFRIGLRAFLKFAVMQKTVRVKIL